MLKQHWTSAWEDGSYDDKDFMEVVFMEKENMAAPSYYRSVFQRVAALMESPQHTHSPNSIKHEQDIVNREPPQLTPSLKLEKDTVKREPLANAKDTNAKDTNKKQLYTAYKNETHLVQQLKRQLEVANNENMEKERNLQNILQYIDDQLDLTTINNNIDLAHLQYIQYQENMINQNMVALNEQQKEIEDTKRRLTATLIQNQQLDDMIERTTAGIYNMKNQIVDACNEFDNGKNYIRIIDTFLSLALAPTMAPVLENPSSELRDAMISFLNANPSTTSTSTTTTSNNYTSQLVSESAAITHEPSTINLSDQSFPQDVSYSPMTSSHDTPSSVVTPLDDIPYSPSLSDYPSPSLDDIPSSAVASPQHIPDSPLFSLDDIPSSVVASPQHIPDSPLFSLDDIPSSVVASPPDIFYSAMTSPESTFYSTMTSPVDIDRLPTATSTMALFSVDYHQESM